MNIEDVKLIWHRDKFGRLVANLGGGFGGFWICSIGSRGDFAWNYCGPVELTSGECTSEQKACDSAENYYQGLLKSILPEDNQ